MNPKVEYRDIPGFPGYRVGSDGTVWSNRCNRKSGWVQRRTWISRGGYPRLDLSVNNRPVRCTVAHLVLVAFVGPRKPGTVARHFPDNDKTNNSPNNLQWGTLKENTADQKLAGTLPIGEKVWSAKLTASDVRKIRKLRRQRGLSHQRIADQFGVGRSQIQRICAGEKWKHVA
jgi:hypothetical protein